MTEQEANYQRYRERMMAFAGRFVEASYALSLAVAEADDAKRVLEEKQCVRHEANLRHYACERALRHLMQMGANGLADYEEPQKAITMEDFLATMDMRGER